MSAASLNMIHKFFVKEDGGLTVEGVLWVPVYVFFFGLIADVSLMFNSQTQVQRALQDVNRLASSGFLVSEEEVESRILAVISHLTTNATVETTFDTTNGLVTTTARVPASDLMAIGLVSKFATMELNFSSQHLVES